MFPITIKTKYAFHALLWFLKPGVVLDVGSMDGADSKRFRKLLPMADVIAFEGNPDNYRAMLDDAEIAGRDIRVEHRLVSNITGSRAFFLQRPEHEEPGVNKGTSSAIWRNESSMKTEEVSIDSVRVDTFLRQEYPDKQNVAMWIDVEGHAYEVLEGSHELRDRVCVIHMEVETQEVWPGQKLETDVLDLAKKMGFVLVARGKHATQRDIVLVRESWYASNRVKIFFLLHVCKWFGSLFVRTLMAMQRINTSSYFRQSRSTRAPRS